MKVENILEYQKLDTELFKLEKELKENSNRKKAEQMAESIKNAQARSVKLEEKAGVILSEIEKVKKQYQTQQDKLNEFFSKDLESMGKDELDKLRILKDKLAQNLQILEKNLTSLAENMNAVLADFNKTIKNFNSAKEEYAKCKSAYENDVKALDGKKGEITGRLKGLAQNVDSSIMEMYNKKRKENVFPVLVPLMEMSKGSFFCGGCHTQLPFASLTKLDEQGIATCDHCRRIIYKK